MSLFTRSPTSDSGHCPLCILIIDEDSDCVDALKMLLTDIPGVGNVLTATNAAAALTELAAPKAGGTVQYPDVIFIDLKTRVDRMASTQATLRALRRRMPAAEIVLLNVYPSGITRSLRGLVDRSIRKDTSYRELRALIDELTDTPTSTVAGLAAG